MYFYFVNFSETSLKLADRAELTKITARCRLFELQLQLQADVLVVAVLLPLPLVRLHHALALHRVRVGHQTPAADLGSSRQKSWDYTIHRRIDNNF